MRCLLAGRWRDGILDAHRRPAEVRVHVLAWLPLMPLDDVTVRRPRSLRLIWNYAHEIGLRATVVKVASRHQERFRNEVCLATGLGRVLDAPGAARVKPGDVVEFVAPRHPPAVERIVVAQELVRVVEGELLNRLDDGSLVVLARGSPVIPVAGELLAIAGWSPLSGVVVGPETGRACLVRAHEELAAARWDAPTRLSPGRPDVVAERHVHEPGLRAGQKTAVIFGYGNYAKTAILPSLPAGLRVTSIHEIDPLQMPRRLDRAVCGGHHVSWDTAPAFRSRERYDAAFIAGFHHEHAPLAIAALRQGAVAVVEKPAVTTELQLQQLLEAMRCSGSRLFLCFHKRYSPFNGMARADLGVEPGGAISYHCIVYEAPVPQRHWYRWPNSRSSIVSNGCHWLDHFLFLNDYARVRETTLAVAHAGTVCCAVILQNGAVFTMTLTHEGSDRVGVRDHVELRANGVTVTIDDGADYRAESRDRVLRTSHHNRLAAYGAMYATIGRNVLSGEPGDSLRSVEVSSRVVLALDQLLLAGATSGARTADGRHREVSDRLGRLQRISVSRA